MRADKQVTLAFRLGGYVESLVLVPLAPTRVGKASKDGLEPGVYRVYLRKQGHWQAFFCQDDKPVGCSDECQAGLDNEHKPKFVDAGTAIRYGWFKFSF